MNSPADGIKVAARVFKRDVVFHSSDHAQGKWPATLWSRELQRDPDFRARTGEIDNAVRKDTDDCMYHPIDIHRLSQRRCRGAELARGEHVAEYNHEG